MSERERKRPPSRLLEPAEPCAQCAATRAAMIRAGVLRPREQLLPSLSADGATVGVLTLLPPESEAA